MCCSYCPRKHSLDSIPNKVKGYGQSNYNEQEKEKEALKPCKVKSVNSHDQQMPFQGKSNTLTLGNGDYVK